MSLPDKEPTDTSADTSSLSVNDLLRKKQIHEIINPRLVQTLPKISLRDAVEKMRENRSGYIVIATDGKVEGIFTEYDVLFKVLGKSIDWQKPVSDFMTADPIVLSPDDSVGEAIDVMGEHQFYHIPLVSDKNELVGILSVRSLIRFLAEFYPTEVFNLPPKIDQIMETPEGG